MSYLVNERDLSKITLNEKDLVTSVLQNVAIILATRQQSVPLYREFGLSMEFVDKPVTVAKPLIVAEVSEAISLFEPRASLVDVTFEIDEKTPGKLVPTVEVEINVE